MTIEEKLVRKEIEAKRNFVSIAESLCEVVQKFDGKVLNKRLETALKEVYPIRMEIDKDFGWFGLTGYIPDRMVQSDIVNRNGYRTTAYIKDDKIYICSCMRNATDKNGRIVAENICKRIREVAEYEEQTADRLADQIDHIDEIKAEHARIIAERDGFINRIAPQIRKYYGLEMV